MKLISKSLNNYFDSKKKIAPLFIRLFTGFHLLYGVTGIILNNEKMKDVSEYFLSLNIHPSTFWAPVAVYAEFICGLLFIAGFFTRFAALVMVIVFITAICFAHLGDTYINSFAAIAMLSGSLSLLFTGAGSVSIDALLKN